MKFIKAEKSRRLTTAQQEALLIVDNLLVVEPLGNE
jgi:hypothetical protein